MFWLGILCSTETPFGQAKEKPKIPPSKTEWEGGKLSGSCTRHPYSVVLSFYFLASENNCVWREMALPVISPFLTVFCYPWIHELGPPAQMIYRVALISCGVHWATWGPRWSNLVLELLIDWLKTTKSTIRNMRAKKDHSRSFFFWPQDHSHYWLSSKV